MFQLLRIFLVGFGVLGFLFQSLAGVTGAGQALCIGCERSWWTVSQLCDPMNGIDCCEEDEARADGPGHPDHQPSARGQGDCGCIDVPLPGHQIVAVAIARLHPTSELVACRPVPVIRPVWTWDVPAVMTTWARAGPRSPPRLLVPQSRCTVLVI